MGKFNFFVEVLDKIKKSGFLHWTVCIWNFLFGKHCSLKHLIESRCHIQVNEMNISLYTNFVYFYQFKEIKVLVYTHAICVTNCVIFICVCVYIYIYIYIYIYTYIHTHTHTHSRLLFYDDSLLQPLLNRTEHSRLVLHHCHNSSVLSRLSALPTLLRCACVSSFSVLVQFF